jgi:hypothetical protein
MRYLKTNRLYCFSPPVMLVTIIIELGLAAYVLFRYKMNTVSRLGTGILVALATFQIAEYNVCEGAWGLSGMDWARLGYVAITLLPPLGLHMAIKIRGQSRPRLIAAVYGTGAIFAGIFLFVGNGMQYQECLGNYVIFKIARWSVLPYTAYYYGWLLVGTVATLGYAHKLADPHKRVALRALGIGYLSFILPTTAAVIVDPSVISGIPSIMCGFAVILALHIGFYVIPHYDMTVKDDSNEKVPNPTTGNASS